MDLKLSRYVSAVNVSDVGGLYTRSANCSNNHSKYPAIRWKTWREVCL